MKKYKVGDTIYAKGKIMQADESHGKFPYCVSFSDSDFTGIIDMCHAWLDEDSFVESPVKPMMPKDVADEMSFAKSIKGVTFDDYIVRELIRSDYKDSATNKMIQSSDIPNAIEVLLNAWNNGYTVAAEPNYLAYLPLPVSDLKNHNCAQLYHFADKPILQVKWSPSKTTELQYKDERYQFTKEEIDQLRVDYPAVEIKESHTDED